MRGTPTRRRREVATHRGIGMVQTITLIGTTVMLIGTVLTPALMGLRDRHRQAVCTARIGMLTRAMLVYAADYDETPPFMGLGWEDIHYPDEPSRSLTKTQDAPGDIPTKSRWGWAVAETWVTQHPELLWNGLLPEDEWAQNGVGVETGLLFPYARHKRIYCCPAFERIGDKSQSTFNYTRTFLGRKWVPGEYSSTGPGPDYWGNSDFGAPGLILGISQIHLPAQLPLLYDEWWLAHVGAPYDWHIPPRESSISGGWSAVDCMYFPFADVIGQYHGRPSRGEWFSTPSPYDVPARQGNVACYDGHVELERDMWPERSEGLFPIFLIEAMVNWMHHHFHAQTGSAL